MVDHKLHAVFLKLSVLERHNTVADQYAFEVDSFCFLFGVVNVDFDSKVGYVLASIGLSCDPEVVRGILWVLGEEVGEGAEAVSGCRFVVIGEAVVTVD